MYLHYTNIFLEHQLKKKFKLLKLINYIIINVKDLEEFNIKLVIIELEEHFNIRLKKCIYLYVRIATMCFYSYYINV